MAQAFGCRLVERIAEAQRFHAAFELGVETFGDALVHEQPRNSRSRLRLG